MSSRLGTPPERLRLAVLLVAGNVTSRVAARMGQEWALGASGREAEGLEGAAARALSDTADIG
jgi:hypothetical protein